MLGRILLVLITLFVFWYESKESQANPDRPFLKKWWRTIILISCIVVNIFTYSIEQAFIQGVR